jgi:hypothetical protein
MDRIPVQSSNVAEVGYEPETMILEVLFHDGNIYQYFDVHYLLYEELLRTDSVDSFLNAQIKNVCRYVRL